MMEGIRKSETDSAPDYKYNPQKAKPSSNKLKHKIPHFDWTIRMIRQFAWMQITWVAHKLFKNPIAAKKNGTKKKRGYIQKAMILLKSIH